MFSDVDLATKLVHDAFETPISINGKYLSITYSHPNSFVPVYGSSEWITYSYLDTEYKLVEIAYWDEPYFAKEYPKSPPIDPSLIAGRWIPPEAISQYEPASESLITVSKEPVMYDDPSKNDSAPEESSSFTHISKKKKILNPKDKTSAQIMKWQERQEELADYNEEETIDLSDDALKKVLLPLMFRNFHQKRS